MISLIDLRTIEEWKAWLEVNHTQEREVWLIFQKAETGIPCIRYDDAVEEAICYGWIDSLIRKLDDQRYARKFTRRTDPFKWSPSNRRRVVKLLRENRMQPAGRAVLGDLSEFIHDSIPERRPEIAISPGIEAVIRENPLAWENYLKLSPAKRNLYFRWVTSAKRETTIQKRLLEVLGCLVRDVPLGMK